VEKFIAIVYKIFQWMVRFAFVNILWFLFSIVGLIILGIAPATSSMFGIVRKWIMGQEDIPIFKTFWQTYRSDFKKSNLIGFFLMAVGFILYIDFRFLITLDGLLLHLMTFAFISLLILYLIILFFIFPTFVHFQLTVLQYFKYAIIIGVFCPHITFLMAIAVIALYFIVTAFPGFFPFFSASTLSFSMMWLAFYAFRKIKDNKPA
jgi:uncharacterized membrane protein YesL